MKVSCDECSLWEKSYQMRVILTERPSWRAWFCAGVVGACAWYSNEGCRMPNTALQLTASRARSLLFGRWSAARSRQLNAKSLGAGHRCRTHIKTYRVAAVYIR